MYQGVAQLVAHLLWEQGVVGSSPAILTNILSNYTLNHIYQSVGQLVVRLSWIQEVAGSSPAILTNYNIKLYKV